MNRINLQSVFEGWPTMEDPAIQKCLASAATVTLQPGDQVFHAGASCEAYLLVLRGDVRVQMLTEAGRAVTLYHVREGNTCVLTTACLLGDTHYPAEAVVEQETLAVAIPKPDFNRMMNESPDMRRFVFANLGQRFAGVIGRIEQITFRSIDQRIASALLEKSVDGQVDSTHQDLATETGTVREVISRHLKRLEDDGVLRLGRGRIEVSDRSALERLARGG